MREFLQQHLASFPSPDTAGCGPALPSGAAVRSLGHFPGLGASLSCWQQQFNSTTWDGWRFCSGGFRGSTETFWAPIFKNWIIEYYAAS